MRDKPVTEQSRSATKRLPGKTVTSQTGRRRIVARGDDRQGKRA